MFTDGFICVEPGSGYVGRGEKRRHGSAERGCVCVCLWPSDPWVQRCKSPVGNPQLIQLSREIIDLMKSQPSCSMPVSKFIPSYHHHFGRQCKLTYYGFTKLMELFEAIPEVLQVGVTKFCHWLKVPRSFAENYSYAIPLTVVPNTSNDRIWWK